MNDPDFIDIEPNIAEDRARPGLKGMNLKVLFGFFMVGLAPVIVALFLMWPIKNDSSQVSQELDSKIQQQNSQISSLSQTLAQLEREQKSISQKHINDLHELEIRRGRENLAAKLAGLLKGKNVEEVTADTAAKEALDAFSGPFEMIALLDPDSKTILLTNPSKPTAEQKKEFDVFISKSKLPSIDTPLSLAKPGWHQIDLAGSNYLALFKVSEVKPAVEHDKPSTQSQVRQLQPQQLQSFTKALSSRIWVLSIGLPVMALALAIFFFLYLHRSLLAPLTRVIKGARKVLDTPDEVDDLTFAGTKLVEDLSATLIRLNGRMCRLQELDDLNAERKRSLNLLRQTIEQAASGDFEVRAEIDSGEAEELVLAVNQFLDKAAERYAALRQAGLQLKDSARRVGKLAIEISSSATAPGSLQNSDHTALGEILGVEIESLTRVALEMAERVESDSPRSWSPDDQQEMKNTLDAAASGLHLLFQKTKETSNEADRITALRQDVEVLSTNMAIAAEARSWSSLEQLVESARELSRSILELSESVQSHLEQVESSGQTLNDTIKKAIDLSSDCLASINKWEGIRETLQSQRSDLNARLDRIRPAAKTLGNDVRQQTDELSQYRESLSSINDTLQSIGDGCAALSRTSEEMLELLKQTEHTRPVPAGVTRDLAKTQQALERSMRDLTELAAKGGIESLSADASAILDNIRAAAEEAKQRVLLTSEDDQSSSSTQAESDA
ncbi:MAG: hypothetical protein JRJ87_16110 [Deltaproteobacteria bacterium]|nr:hypothetical protein [Deltaproteobacteria bacterium]